MAKKSIQLMCQGIYMRKAAYGVWGQFGSGAIADGQAVRTRSVYSLMVDRYGEKSINKCDTNNWKKHPFSFLVKSINLFFRSENIIIFPADNGFKVITSLYHFLSLFSKRRIFYFVIGGFLPGLLQQKPKYFKYIKKYKAFFVQTNLLKEYLDEKNLENVYLVPNFKKLPVIQHEDILTIELKSPYKLCVVSRITKEKGILDAIRAVILLNEQGSEKYELDFFGQIDEEFSNEFTSLINKYSFLQYKGIIPFDKTNLILRNYHAMLFPTYYYGEGFAGCLIDAFHSGLPVIASDWMANPTIIKDGINGYIHKVRSIPSLIEKINLLFSNSANYFQIRMTNYIHRIDFDGETLMKDFFTIIENRNN